MNAPAQFAYGNRDPSQLPLIPLRLAYAGASLIVSALVDSGASVNVLPYDIGVKLALNWDSQTIPLRLSGNLGNHEARAVLIHGAVEPFSPVMLAFAWTKASGVPVILGQQNFFMEFDICFLRSQCRLEIKPK